MNDSSEVVITTHTVFTPNVSIILSSSLDDNPKFSGTLPLALFAPITF